ncbi:hypothetical protein F2Q68_00005480 [Brassica cretica]|uniref:Uncharacterized protein n=1 Tax=Brassica cretica TaxID=69181 RepID=A0A8S9J647_BRACR|nr:hypothetical protein F2Q68_00005480 [Brassica cretica]
MTDLDGERRRISTERETMDPTERERDGGSDGERDGGFDGERDYGSGRREKKDHDDRLKISVIKAQDEVSSTQVLLIPQSSNILELNSHSKKTMNDVENMCGDMHIKYLNFLSNLTEISRQRF